MTTELFVAEGVRLVQEAAADGVRLRIVGSLACRLHCPQNRPLLDRLERDPLGDIDFAAERAQTKEVRRFLDARGYVEDQMITVATEGTRLYLEHPETAVGVDVFFDELNFCHRIPFKGRLDLDEPTITTTDLLLQKMQIVEINLKDIKDTVVLLLEHEVKPSRNGRESIDASYASELLADDWGFYYTVTENLKKVKRFLPQFDAVGAAESDVVSRRIDHLLEAIEAEPKSRKWKLRAKVGTKKRWYQEVGEKDAGF